MADVPALSHLPLQAGLVASAFEAFADEDDVRAIVLLGSLAGGSGDRVSDADVIVFTRNGFHGASGPAFERFEAGRDIFYRLDGGTPNGTAFRKYILFDLTSAEIHCVDLSMPFDLSAPVQVQIDKDSLVPGRRTDAPAPKHADFPVYANGDDGLIWELFDFIKWLSRGDADVAKGYLRRLGKTLSSSPHAARAAERTASLPRGRRRTSG